jgi:hypothetical protein
MRKAVLRVLFAIISYIIAIGTVVMLITGMFVRPSLNYSRYGLLVSPGGWIFINLNRLETEEVRLAFENDLFPVGVHINNEFPSREELCRALPDQFELPRFDQKGAFVPSWTIMLSATLLLIAPSALRKRSGDLDGHCPCCLYNLTGADHLRCPECGWAVMRKRVPHPVAQREVGD